MPKSNLTNPPNLPNPSNLPNLQLTTDGEFVPWMQAPPHRLTERQRDLMRFVRFRGGITTRDARRFYADAGGALRRLEVLGLVKRRGNGGWEAT